ncbi:hypothetical protein CLOM_g11482 [Closterium sp. NIES-68]|nr:hypothetical protein CLOM_g11482 [Closterium sp. NIES-68]GJP79383.1 hypothetical protein CLOP_g9620 [Closterium sp. NIES-67]
MAHSVRLPTVTPVGARWDAPRQGIVKSAGSRWRANDSLGKAGSAMAHSVRPTTGSRCGVEGLRSSSAAEAQVAPRQGIVKSAGSRCRVDGSLRLLRTTPGCVCDTTPELRLSPSLSLSLPRGDDVAPAGNTAGNAAGNTALRFPMARAALGESRGSQTWYLRRESRRTTRWGRHVAMCARDETGGSGAGERGEEPGDTNETGRVVIVPVGFDKNDGGLSQPSVDSHSDTPANGAACNAAVVPPANEAASSSRSGGGTILGAVALIIGTSVGAGVLALPSETAPAGVFPSSFVLIACWAFLCLEALLLAEVNVALLKERSAAGSSAVTTASSSSSSSSSSGGTSSSSSSSGAVASDSEPERGSDVLSYRTMAEATLGPVGGTVATLAYVFLSFTLIIAYFAKGGEVLAFGTGLPNWVGAVGFFAVLGGFIYSGSTRTADIINRVLTAGLLGIFTLLVCGGAAIADWDELAVADWSEMPTTLPVIFLALVFHDLIPVICTYLDANLGKIRAAIVMGSAAPLSMFLVWDGISLSISPSTLTSATAAGAAATTFSSSLSSLLSSLSTSLSHLASSLPSSLSTALSTPPLPHSLPHSLLSSPFQDPLSLLLLQGTPLQSSIVLTFSFLAVATSFLGTSLALAEFYMEQLGLLVLNRSEAAYKEDDCSDDRGGAGVTDTTGGIGTTGHTSSPLITGLDWVRSHVREAGFLLALCPPLLVALANPGAFVAASKAAGAYGMTVLYGIMPPLMFYAHHKQEALACDPTTRDCSKHHRWLEPGGSFALASMGACAFSVIAGQAVLDASFFSSPSTLEAGSIVLAQSDSLPDSSAQCDSLGDSSGDNDESISSSSSNSSNLCTVAAAVVTSPAAVASRGHAVNPHLVYASQSAPDTSDLCQPLLDETSVVEI